MKSVPGLESTSGPETGSDVSVERVYRGLRTFSVALVVPALLLVGFSYSFHFAMTLGVPASEYPSNLQSIVPALYEALTYWPLPIGLSLCGACFGAYITVALVAGLVRRHRSAPRDRMSAVTEGLLVALFGTCVILYGWAFSFLVPAQAGSRCAIALRMSTGHATVSCGWITHGGPVYLVLTPDAQRELRYQRAFLDANRHGLLRRVLETDTELFLISVPAANRLNGRPTFAPLWRIAKSSIRLSSEQLPGKLDAR